MSGEFLALSIFVLTMQTALLVGCWKRISVLESQMLRVAENMVKHGTKIVDLLQLGGDVDVRELERALDCRLNEERDLSTARYHRLRKRIQRVERDVVEGKSQT